jgi:photosystem II stability/assembly factor-like uncharacterized protein
MGRFVLACAFLPLALSGIASADWESLGPEGGDVRHVTQSTLDAGTIYGFTDSSPTQVLKSTNGGDTWTKAGTFNNTEYCAAMSPAGTLFVGCGSYVYYSTNGGVSWTASSYIQNTMIYGIAPHPTDPSIVYAACYRYDGTTWVLSSLKSTNGGATWTYTDLNAVQTYATDIAISQTNPNLLFITGYSYDNVSYAYAPLIYRSTNAGATWTNVTPAAAATDYYGQSVAVGPTDANLVLFGTLYGMYRSTDGGANWTKVSTYNYFYQVTFSPANPNYVYAGGYQSFYRSTNAGLTWSTSSTGLAAVAYQCVAPHLTTAASVYTSCTLGFYRSTDTGVSWVCDDDGLVIGRVLAWGIAPSQPSRIYMQMLGLGIWLTTNNGSAWTHLTTPLTCGDFCGLAVKPTDPNYVLALEGSG